MAKNMISFHRHKVAGTLSSLLGNAIEFCESKYASKQLAIEFDIDAGLECEQMPGSTLSTIRDLVEQACERSPAGCQVLITVVETTAGIEVEVADEGQMVLGEGDSVLESAGIQARKSREAWRQVVTSTAEVFCTNCPQGGVAWTVVIPAAMQAQNAA